MRDPETTIRRSVIARRSAAPDETEAIAAQMARALDAGDVLILTGELGAGKTTFVRGLAKGLGVAIGVKSPSFAIHLRYPGPLPLHHLDLYRLGSSGDLAELGLEDVLEREGVTVIEWGERLGDWIPERAVRIRLEDRGASERQIIVQAPLPLIERLRSLGGWEDV
ncbi:MAG TPA: tRNA (adenosine(37)-N6)-threonylcarbamoyltransferase complex ATPase subunit type 1 TsaE [Candidatus Eisenbacteria bacterium]|nr:tRNA (adenosine(37)-N6)-threonylcarbamoyltransferase complex ATPase subunit type 1 TsaE [Candidatus Eisenbacteria bacterium]